MELPLRVGVLRLGGSWRSGRAPRVPLGFFIVRRGPPLAAGIATASVTATVALPLRRLPPLGQLDLLRALMSWPRAASYPAAPPSLVGPMVGTLSEYAQGSWAWYLILGVPSRRR